jgi:outer membrane protein OmpA-like peptidoglycan-associated protein
MKRLGLVKPIVTAAGILALSGVAVAQREGDAKGWMGGMSHELVASANCPQLQVTKEKITEDQARDLAQQYADKNLAGFKVVKPLGYGGGYTTVCYKIGTPQTGRYQPFYSVEYSIDAKNAAETRNLRVDQFGYVTEFSGPFGMAGERGPAGAQGPAGPMGPQAMANPVGAQSKGGAVGDQSQAGAMNRSFKDILFDTDKSDIRANETSKVADVATYIKQNPTFQVGINGYADPRGTDQHNQALSQRRVNAIRDALVKAGVASDKIQTGAFGEQRLQCNESTDACWQRDRRVDVGFRTDK